MSDDSDWHELVDRHLRGELDEPEQERLAELLDSDAAARKDFVEHVQWDTRFSEVLRDSRGSLPGSKSVAEPNQPEGASPRLSREPAASAERLIRSLDDLGMRERTRPPKFTRALLAVAALIIVVLSASLFFRQPNMKRPIEKVTDQQPEVERTIAKITGLSGPLQWTGDGGRVSYDLSVGVELAGGTVEGLAPGSWFELKFNDGSTATISGNSMLTFSDHGQKELHLKEGNLSSNVKPQPADKPMLIYTRSAMLEVLGTQFEVEAQFAATTLNVSKGKMRVKRFSDGSTVDVLAKHRVIAAADREMLPVPVPDSVNRWKSQLHLGPVGQGKWSPGTDTQEARLRAVPWSTPQGMTIYTLGFGVSPGDKPPVVLQRDSRVRVRGRIASSHKVYFGVTVRQASGEFAGMFDTNRPAVEFSSGQDFEVVLHLGDYRPVPSPGQMKDKLPRVPFGLVVEAFWCHTLAKQAGLEIVELELIPPLTEDKPESE